MTRRTTTARRTASAATARPRHELDEVLIDQSKTRMKGTAAPLLARINKLEKAATKNIAKRETFVEGASELKDDVRTAYDEGDEAAIAKIAKGLDSYEASLLRPSKRAASKSSR